MKIAVFCGARMSNNPIYQSAASHFGQLIASLGHSLVYGGSNLGYMGVVSNATLQAGGHVTGIIPTFFSDEIIYSQQVSDLILVKDFAERKAVIADMSDVFVALPGGIGTLDEVTEMLTFNQIKRFSSPKVMAILNVDGFYDSFLLQLKKMVVCGLFDESTFKSVVVADSPQALMDEIVRKNPKLSKSKYVRGLQCYKALYLDVYKPKLACYDSATLELFKGGRLFESMVKSTFPDGVDMSGRARTSSPEYVAATRNLLCQSGRVVLFEAGFVFDDVFVMADVLVKHPDGCIDLYEVKNSLRVSDTFRNDVSVQHYVICNALQKQYPDNLHLHVRSFSIVYNDGNDGPVKEDLLDYAVSQTEMVASRIGEMRDVLRHDEPVMDMGNRCVTPYACPYEHYCSKSRRT